MLSLITASEFELSGCRLIFICSILLQGCFIFLKAQTSNPGPYCKGTYSNVPCSSPAAPNSSVNQVNDFIDSLYTTGATINLNNSGSGCNGLPDNYIFYCNKTLVVSQGQIIVFYLKSGNMYGQGFGIFVDWNQNNQFDLPSELLNPSQAVSTATAWSSFTYTIPANQANGLYRLRIRSSYATPPLNISPCGSHQWGETEDYPLFLGSATVSPVATTATASCNFSICSGQTTSFQLIYTGSTPTSYSWTGPAGFSSAFQNPFLFFTPNSGSGAYHCSMSTGTCPLLATTFLWVQETPTLQIGLQPNYPYFCQGVTLHLTCSGYNNIVWPPSNASFTSTYISPTSSAVYTAIASTPYGCTATATLSLTVLPSFTLQCSSSQSIVCTGETISLTASGAEYYHWSTGQNGPTVAFTPTANTLISVTGSGSLCSASASIQIIADPCLGIPAPNSPFADLKYNNPFNSLLRLNCSDNPELIFYDSNGKLLASYPPSSVFEIPAGHLSTGYYFILLSTPVGRKAIKVIKD